MNELLLVVTIAGERVALPAAAVESVVELDTLIPVPRAAPHIAGLSALRSRVLTVVDCMRSLELGETDCSDGIREAAVVELDGHHYALIVDLVEDVVEAASDPLPVRAAMGEGWERVSKGMVETETGPLLLIDVGALVAGALAQWFTPSTAMTAMAVLSLLVTLRLARGLRAEREGEAGGEPTSEPVTAAAT